MKQRRSNKMFFVVNKRGSPWRLRDGRMWVDHMATAANWLANELNIPIPGGRAWGRSRKHVEKGRPWKAVWLRLPSRVIRMRCLPVTDAMVAEEKRRQKAR